MNVRKSRLLPICKCSKVENDASFFKCGNVEIDPRFYKRGTVEIDASFYNCGKVQIDAYLQKRENSNLFAKLSKLKIIVVIYEMTGFV